MIYRFGRYRLDSEALELRGREGVVSAEPRVLETLIHLVRNAGRVVSKDELARSVWEGAHVTDSAIARSVMGARRALGEDASRSTAIRTVHSRGYRFDLPVEELETEPGAPRSRTGRDPGQGQSPGRSPGRRPAVAAALLLLLALVAGALWWSRKGSPPAAGAASPTPVGLEVTAPPEGSELPLLALSLDEELRRAVDEVPEVRLVDDGASERPAFVLTARLTPGATPGFAHLAVAVRPAESEAGASVPSPIPLARHEIPYRLPDVGTRRFLAVRSAVARQIAARLPLAVGPGDDRSEIGSEADRLYLLATAGWDLACDRGVASELLRRAVELDPKLAPAWYLLAVAYMAEVELCIGDAALLDEAERAARRAIELDPEWPDPYKVTPTNAFHEGRVDEAYRALSELAAEFPDSRSLRTRLSDVLRYTGFVDAAGELLDEILRDHPESSILWDYVPYPDLYRGRWERFLDGLSGRTSPYFRYYRGYAEAMRGDREAAARALEPAFLDHPGDLFARLCQALLAHLRGDSGEARVVLRQLVRQRAERGVSDGEVTYKIGQLLVLAGAADEGLEQLALAVEQGFFCPRCLANDPVLETVADDPRFRAVLATATARHRRFARDHGLAPEEPEGPAQARPPAPRSLSGGGAWSAPAYGSKPSRSKRPSRSELPGTAPSRT